MERSIKGGGLRWLVYCISLQYLGKEIGVDSSHRFVEIAHDCADSVAVDMDNGDLGESRVILRGAGVLAEEEFLEFGEVGDKIVSVGSSLEVLVFLEEIEEVITCPTH